VTIHKSQGKSFDKVALDLGDGAFAAGQVYVALSRCTSFEGLYLVKPMTIQQIKLDGAVIRYMDSWREAAPTAPPPKSRLTSKNGNENTVLELRLVPTSRSEGPLKTQFSLKVPSRCSGRQNNRRPERSAAQ